MKDNVLVFEILLEGFTPRSGETEKEQMRRVDRALAVADQVSGPSQNN